MEGCPRVVVSSCRVVVSCRRVVSSCRAVVLQNVEIQMRTPQGPQRHFHRILHGMWATATFRATRNISKGTNPEAQIAGSGCRRILLEFLLTESSFRMVFGSGKVPGRSAPFSNPSGRGPEGEVREAGNRRSRSRDPFRTF